MNETAMVVHVRDLSKTFGVGDSRVDALRGVDLDIARGEFVAVMGPSGSGKSTLLHLIGGLDTPDRGSISVDGTQLDALTEGQLTELRRKRFGFVFQAFNLIDVLTAEENVALPLIIDGIEQREAHRRALETLSMIEMADRRNHLPGQLSGGQQQRLALARALVTRPLLLLADEPTGNLDSANSDQIMTMLRGFADQHAQTILMVTHNARHAAMADRLIELRDGHVEQEHESRTLGPQEVLKNLEPRP